MNRNVSPIVQVHGGRCDGERVRLSTLVLADGDSMPTVIKRRGSRYVWATTRLAGEVVFALIASEQLLPAGWWLLDELMAEVEA